MTVTSTTSILKVDPSAPNPADIQHAADLIRNGDLVAFPTETVYGLGANAFNADAVAKIYLAKGRPATDPVIVHVASAAMLAEVAASLPSLAHPLIERFWPGPLTLVLPRGKRIPPNVSAGLPTVAVRMPSHPVALALIAAAGVPIAAPSANLFARTSPTTALHVMESLGGRIPLILDGGSALVGVESTILDLSGDTPTILRFGGVPIEALEDLAPEMRIGVRQLADRDASRGAGTSGESDESGEKAMPAPGMLITHYAPRARLTLIGGDDGEIRRAMTRLVRDRIQAGEMIGLLLADEDRDVLLDFPDQSQIRCVMPGSLRDLDQVAHSLYAALHTLDGYGVVRIFTRVFPDEGIGRAINDRLIRAASGQVVR